MAFVARARAAGVSATLDVFDDQVHDFQAFGALSRISVEAIARVGEAVQVFAPVPKMATGAEGARPDASTAGDRAIPR